jgi:hypothetical protein
VSLAVDPAVLTLTTIVPTAGVLPNITTTTLADGVLDTAYSATLASANGPVTWAVVAGTLPTGLSLASSTGVISGTPTVPELASFTVAATNSIGTDTQALTLLIPNEVSGEGELPVLVEVTPAALTLGPQNLVFGGTALANIYVDHPSGEIALAGQHVDVYPGFPLDIASLVLTGQEVALSQGIGSSVGMSVEPATLSFAGAEPAMPLVFSCEIGTLTLTPQDALLAVADKVQRATLTFTWQDVLVYQEAPPGTTLAVEPAELVLAGEALPFWCSLAPEPGTLALTPRNLDLAIRFPVDSGEWLYVQTQTANIWVRVETRN